MILVRELKMIDIEDIAELTTELGYPTSAEEMKARILEIKSNNNIWTFVAEQKKQSNWICWI